MHLFELKSSNEGIELSQVHGIVLDASFAAEVLQKSRRRTPKRTNLAYAKEPCLTELDQPLGKVLLRLPEVACSSAFAKASSSEHFVDMPDPTPPGET